MNDFWSISLNTYTASTLGLTTLYSPTPPPRLHTCLTPITPSLLLLFGGRSPTTAQNTTATVYGDIWVYDIPHDRWTEATAWFSDVRPSARAGMSCVGDGKGRAWVFGGEDDKGMRNDLWMLDVGRWSWELLSKDIGIPVGAVLDVGNAGNGTVVGSANATNAMNGTISTNRTASNNFGSVNGNTSTTQPTSNPPNTWRAAHLERKEPRQLPSSPEPGHPPRRAYHQSLLINTYLLITGGATAINLTESIPTDRYVYFYDTKAQKWISDVSQIQSGSLFVTRTPLPASDRRILAIGLGVGAGCLAFMGLAILIYIRGRRKKRNENIFRKSALADKRASGAHTNSLPPYSSQTHNLIRFSDLSAVSIPTTPQPLVPLPGRLSTSSKHSASRQSVKSVKSVKSAKSYRSAGRTQPKYLSDPTRKSTDGDGDTEEGRPSSDPYPQPHPYQARKSGDSSQTHMSQMLGHFPSPPPVPREHKNVKEEEGKKLTLGNVFGNAGAGWSNKRAV